MVALFFTQQGQQQSDTQTSKQSHNETITNSTIDQLSIRYQENQRKDISAKHYLTLVIAIENTGINALLKPALQN